MSLIDSLTKITNVIRACSDERKLQKMERGFLNKFRRPIQFACILLTRKRRVELIAEKIVRLGEEINQLIASEYENPEKAALSRALSKMTEELFREHLKKSSDTTAKLIFCAAGTSINAKR